MPSSAKKQRTDDLRPYTTRGSKKHEPTADLAFAAVQTQLDLLLTLSESDKSEREWLIALITFGGMLKTYFLQEAGKTRASEELARDAFKTHEYLALKESIRKPFELTQRYWARAFLFPAFFSSYTKIGNRRKEVNGLGAKQYLAMLSSLWEKTDEKEEDKKTITVITYHRTIWHKNGLEGEIKKWEEAAQNKSSSLRALQSRIETCTQNKKCSRAKHRTLAWDEEIGWESIGYRLSDD